MCNGAFYLLHILLTIGLTTLKRENYLIFLLLLIYFFIYLFCFSGRRSGTNLCSSLRTVRRVGEITGSYSQDPRREMWNFFSPIALFASKPISQGKNELVPVAIQMDFTPGMYEPFFY